MLKELMLITQLFCQREPDCTEFMLTCNYTYVTAYEMTLDEAFGKCHVEYMMRNINEAILEDRNANQDS